MRQSAFPPPDRSRSGPGAQGSLPPALPVAHAIPRRHRTPTSPVGFPLSRWRRLAAPGRASGSGCQLSNGSSASNSSPGCSPGPAPPQRGASRTGVCFIAVDDPPPNPGLQKRVNKGLFKGKRGRYLGSQIIAPSFPSPVLSAAPVSVAVSGTTPPRLPTENKDGFWAKPRDLGVLPSHSHPRGQRSPGLDRETATTRNPSSAGGDAR